MAEASACGRHSPQSLEGCVGAGKNRGQTGEFPFFQSKKSLIGKKGIHQSDPDFNPLHYPIFARATLLNGKRTMKVEPCSSPELSAWTVPPCDSTRCRTIASPRPSPPCTRVRVESACRNLSKT